MNLGRIVVLLQAAFRETDSAPAGFTVTSPALALRHEIRQALGLARVLAGQSDDIDVQGFEAESTESDYEPEMVPIEE